ncbi:hypothetical protein [Aliiroseovarius crassostreae]|uniref:hypothetical protein n=1 Tax=Aliiroseovarius crassostreae TaxID=154981 RepID=UPI003908A55B
MVLTRGYLSRLMVLSGSGNLRALTVLGVVALMALATPKGVLPRCARPCSFWRRSSPAR